jgi:methyl-accepting chemotaxis protein
MALPTFVSSGPPGAVRSNIEIWFCAIPSARPRKDTLCRVIGRARLLNASTEIILKITLNRKLGATILVLWSGLLGIGVLGALQNRASLIADRRAQLQALTQQSFSVADYYANEAAAKVVPVEEAKRRALEAIGAMRYGADGYVAVFDPNMTVLMHPNSTLVGKNLSGTVDASGRNLRDTMSEALDREPNRGFASYRWTKPDRNVPAQKLAFVKRFPRWDWILSTSMYTDDIDEAVFRDGIRWLGYISVFGGLATLVMLAILHSIRRSLGGQLEVAVAAAGKIAEGDLRSPVPVRHGDSSSLLCGLSAMQAGLMQTVSRVRDATENIYVGASQIAAGNTDLSQRVEEQAASLVESARSMNELTASVTRNADNAVTAAEFAAQAAVIAQQGSGAVSKVITTMTRISESSRRVAEIIAVIDGIAFQTNILALNAAVEAARAGEQGKGFAVVASEVRGLAQRSAAAAMEIKLLIEASACAVDEGENLGREAGVTMSEVVVSVERVSRILEEISQSSCEQSVGIEQVNRVVDEMDRTTQQNAALVEETTAAAHSLHQQARALTEAVNSFTLQ